jgi:hypothetical protein
MMLGFRLPYAELRANFEFAFPYILENQHMLARRLQLIPRELGFLLLSLPITVVAFSLLVTGFSAAVGTAIIYIGVPILFGTLFAARWFGAVERTRLVWAGRDEIPAPEWQNPDQKPGFFGSLKAVIANGNYWLHLLHGTIVNFVVSVVTWSIAITWVAGSLGGVTYWIWARFLPQDGQKFRLSEVVADFISPGWGATIDPLLGDNLIYLLVGIIFFATLPLITRDLVRAHHAIARTMLGAPAAQ